MISLRRHRNVSLMLLLIFCLLTGRLWQITFSHGADYTAQVQRQRLLTVSEREYERGDILDCNGRSLTNQAENVLLVFPRLLSTQSNAYWLTYLNSLVKNWQLTANSQSQSLKQLLQNGEPFILARNLSNRQINQLTPILNQTQGIYTTTLRPRYGSAGLAAHLIGYVGASSAAEAAALKQQGVQDTAYTGKSGLEKQYDSLLRGQTSAHIAVTVDEKNQPTSDGLRFIASNNTGTPRHNIQLTLNSNYQSIAENAMRDKNGALVLMDVHNGDVLAMVSAPGFDQYIGQPAANGDIYVNKALSYYPPASVFKIVLCLAALDNQISIDDTATPFQCSGSITLPNGHSVGCWKSSGHGEETLATALGNSCNPYFIQLGQRLGGELIAEYAYRLGMTEQVLVGFSLNSSASQLDFNPNVPADVANVSIGEKGIRATPLMLARLLAAVANDGKLPTPRLVQAVVDNQGQILSELPSAQPQQVVQPESARQVRRYLTQAVQNGTGSPVASDLISIAGKTGTSQNLGVWFAGFFPADEPRWSIAVYISDGQSGGSDAGSVCREIAEKIAQLEDITNQSKV